MIAGGTLVDAEALAVNRRLDFTLAPRAPTRAILLHLVNLECIISINSKSTRLLAAPESKNGKESAVILSQRASILPAEPTNGVRGAGDAEANTPFTQS